MIDDGAGEEGPWGLGGGGGNTTIVLTGTMSSYCHIENRSKLHKFLTSTPPSAAEEAEQGSRCRHLGPSSVCNLHVDSSDKLI